MKIYKVTLSYTTKVWAENENDAEHKAWLEFGTDLLSCESITECGSETAIAVTEDRNAIIQKEQHMVECEVCDCYLIYGDENEEERDLENFYNEKKLHGKKFHFIRCPICDDMINTYGYDCDGEYFDKRIR